MVLTMANGESSYRRFLDGDDEGLFEIIRDYRDGMLLYVNGIVGNIFIAEEIVQETFAKLIIKKPRFGGKSSFKTWIYTIARNLALDELRSNSNNTLPLSEIEGAIEAEESVENDYIKDEEMAILNRALKSLSSDYNQAIRLKYFEEFSNAECARIMRRSVHAFGNLLYRAKGALREVLLKEGYEYENY